jgi:uncharacterized protein YcbX
MAGTHPFDQVALAVGYRWGYAEERIRQLVTGTALDSVPAGWLPAVVIILISLPLSNLLLSQVTGKTSKSYTPRGCRRIGINNGSNLKDEFDAKYAAPAADGVTRVKSLWVYPIKSCGGIEVDGEDIASYGFKYDRQLTFAQLKDTPTLPTDEPAKPRPEREWKFLTQREYPLMATVKLQMWVPDPDSKDYDATSEEAQSGGVLVVSYPSPSKSGKRRSFAVPFAPTEAQIKGRGYKYERITIWKDTVSALNMPFEAPEDLQKYLGVKNEITLFKIDNIGMREVYRCAPRKEDIGYQPVTGFQDAYPIHLINLASVRHLETLLDSTKAPPPKLSVERFRANIIGMLHSSFSLPCAYLNVLKM